MLRFKRDVNDLLERERGAVVKTRGTLFPISRPATATSTTSKAITPLDRDPLPTPAYTGCQ